MARKDYGRESCFGSRGKIWSGLQTVDTCISMPVLHQVAVDEFLAICGVALLTSYAEILFLWHGHSVVGEAQSGATPKL